MPTLFPGAGLDPTTKRKTVQAAAQAAEQARQKLQRR